MDNNTAQGGPIKIILFYLALVAWVISLAVYVTSALGIYFKNSLTIADSLGTGIFFICIPALILASIEGKVQSKEDTTAGFSSSILDTRPRWVLVLAALSFIYTSVNFFICLALGLGGELYEGRYVLMQKGEFIRYLTKTEYIRLQLNGIMLTTGHCIGFYGLALAILSYKKPLPVANTTPLR